MRARLGHCLLNRPVGRNLGLFLVLGNQMDEGADQIVVDLVGTVIGKTQQVQSGCWESM
jgi:hypothetical protein